MRIESIIKRRRGTRITMDGVTYHFAPSEDGRHVAEVLDDVHADRLLLISEGFRPAEPVADALDDGGAGGSQETPDAGEGQAGGEGAPVGGSNLAGEPAGGGELSTGDNPEPSPRATEDMPRDALVALYFARTGEKPHHKLSIKTLVERING